MLAGSAGRGDELESTVGDDGFRKGTHEVEDAALCTLVLAEGFVVHEEVDDVASVCNGALEPVDILLGRKRPVLPTLVGEAECDIVAELVVPEEELELGLDVIGIDIVGAPPSHDVTGALGEHGLVAEVIDGIADGVGIDKLGVAEGDGLHTEILLDGSLVLLHLVLELGVGCERSKRVVIGLAEELDASRSREAAEAVDHLRSVAVELLKRGTGDGERHLERSLALLDSLEEEFIHREVALLGYPLEDGPVGEVVIVMRVLADIEEPVQSESCRLVYLEVQTYTLFHIVVFLIILIPVIRKPS